MSSKMADSVKMSALCTSYLTRNETKINKVISPMFYAAVLNYLPTTVLFTIYP